MKVNYSPTAYNRAYLASVLRTSAQIPLWGTSDTLETLSEIGLRCVNIYRTR